MMFKRIWMMPSKIMLKEMYVKLYEATLVKAVKIEQMACLIGG